MKKIIDNKYILISSMLVIFVSLLAFSFAENSYAVNYIVGEHGSINGHQDNFNELCIETQSDYPIEILPDEGYMVDKIIIDGEENTELTTAAQSTLTYVIEDLDINKDTNIEVTFKEIDNPNLVAMAEEGFNIKVTSEGPGTIISAFENNEGKYLSTDEEEDRTVEWISDVENNALVKSVTINGVEDPSYAGQENGAYVATSGNVDIHVVFEKSNTILPGNEDDETTDEIVEYSVKTTAQSGGDITESYNYTTEEIDEDDPTQEIIYTADDGYVIDTVTINGEAKTVADNVGIGEIQGEYTFVDGNQTIEVTFTNLLTKSSEAGTVSLKADKTELKRGETVNFEITFEPKNTSVDSTFDLDISDYEFVSSDKGELKDNVVSGTITAGTDKEVINLSVKYSENTFDGIVTATLYNNNDKVTTESDVFLVAEDLPLPEYDNEIMDHSDIVDQSLLDSTKTKTNTNKGENVKTGDETNNTIFYVLGIVALLGLIVAFIIKRRVNKKIE